MSAPEVKGEENIHSRCSCSDVRGRTRRESFEMNWSYLINPVCLRGLHKEPHRGAPAEVGLFVHFLTLLLQHMPMQGLKIWISMFDLNLSNTSAAEQRNGINSFGNLGAQALICWLNWFPVSKHWPNQVWAVTFGKKRQLEKGKLK